MITPDGFGKGQVRHALIGLHRGLPERANPGVLYKTG
jgi:hypothetical protein